MRKYNLNKLSTLLACILVSTTVIGCSNSTNKVTENNTSKLVNADNIALEVDENEILTTIKSLTTEKRVLGTS